MVEQTETRAVYCVHNKDNDKASSIAFHCWKLIQQDNCWKFENIDYSFHFVAHDLQQSKPTMMNVVVLLSFVH